MKKSFITLIIMLNAVYVSAQQKKPLLLKVATPTALCNDCKLRIEEYLKIEEGIVKTVVYPQSRYTQVSYLADRTNPENIRIAISNAGYDADSVKANEDSYKELPKTCKKTEDGGHKRK